MELVRHLAGQRDDHQREGGEQPDVDDRAGPWTTPPADDSDQRDHAENRREMEGPVSEQEFARGVPGQQVPGGPVRDGQERARILGDLGRVGARWPEDGLGQSGLEIDLIRVQVPDADGTDGGDRAGHVPRVGQRLPEAPGGQAGPQDRTEDENGRQLDQAGQRQCQRAAQGVARAALLRVGEVAEHRRHREAQHRGVRQRRAAEIHDTRRHRHQERRAPAGRRAEQPAAHPVDEPHGGDRERHGDEPPGHVRDAGDLPDERHQQMEQGEFEADAAVEAAPAHGGIQEVDRAFRPDARDIGVRDLTPAVRVDERNVDPVEAESAGERQQEESDGVQRGPERWYARWGSHEVER